MVSVAGWLRTFACGKYADRFEQLGYSSLPSICQLTDSQIIQLGVPSADASIIMENVLLLKQSVNSLKSPRYLDLTSEPPSRIGHLNTLSVAKEVLVRTDIQSFDSYPSQQWPLRTTYPTENFYSSNQQMIISPSWDDHRSSLHPLESLERLVSLPDSRVINATSILEETSDFFLPVPQPSSATAIVSNLINNSVKRSSTNDELNESTKKSRLSTSQIHDTTTNDHPVVTSLLTRSLNHSLSTNPLPSIRSLTTN